LTPESIKPYPKNLIMNTNFKENFEKGNFLNENIENIENELQPISNTPKKQQMLSDLIATRQKINDVAAQDVVLSEPIVSLSIDGTDEKIGVFYKGTINILQGKTGTHKSRLAELLVSLILQNDVCNTDFVGFRVNSNDLIASYIDTERNLNEAVPLTIQNIREKAGYHKTFNIENFYPTSIKKFSREDRLEAVKVWFEYIRSITDKPIFAVLDVVTDCVKSFNNDGDSLRLFDFLGNMCDDCNATFLLLIHENPASEKARGHTGTEGGHKADVQLQIGWNGDDTDILKLRFLKTRRSAKPQPIYLKYSDLAKGLVLADPNEVKKQNDVRKKTFDIELVKEHIETYLSEQPKLLSEIIERLKEDFERNDRDLAETITGLVDEKAIFYNSEGKHCHLEKAKGDKDKRKVMLVLTPIQKAEQIEITLEKP
jgi:DNA-binding MarR family transcriptional regulator